MDIGEIEKLNQVDCCVNDSLRLFSIACPVYFEELETQKLDEFFNRRLNC